jgi:transposase InsO family protein
MARGRKPPSQTWRTFLVNHAKTMVSVGFFTVPTMRFQVLYVLLVLAHDRRRILHFGVTAHPRAEWTAPPLREAFPWDSAPRFWLRDRDRIFGSSFTKQVEELGIEEVLGAPGVPPPRAYIERKRLSLKQVLLMEGGAVRASPPWLRSLPQNPLGGGAAYLLRDRDRIFEADFVEQVKAMAIKQVLGHPGRPGSEPTSSA